MSLFLFSLAGIPPLGGWLAKFVIFKALVEPDLTVGGVTLAVVVAVNSVIALYYYANVARMMWMNPVPDGDRTPVRVPFRSEEHTSELQSLMRISYAVFCLKKKNTPKHIQ